MSTIDQVGRNISQAFDVILATYKNLDLLFTEMDLEAKDFGYISLTPKFLRWKSDNESSGWLINDFIKLYQREGELSPSEETNQEIGTIYGVEVSFEEDFPKLWIIRYAFDFSYWNRMPAISDHGVFYYSLAENSAFIIKENDNMLISLPVDDRVKKRYWGIVKAVAKSIPLVKVNNRDAIRNEIFAAFESLPE